MLFLSLFFFIFTSHSAVQNFTLEGASKEFDIRLDQVAWGVMAGYDTNSGTNQPFNSCELVPPENENDFGSCHPRRVNGDTTLLIRFIETSDFTNARQAVAQYTTFNNTGGEGGQQNTVVNIGTSANTYLPNQQAQLTFRWAAICRALRGDISPGGFCTEDGAPIAPDGTNLVNGELTIDIGLRGESVNDLVSRQSIAFRLYNPSPALDFMEFQTEPCDGTSDGNSGFCDLGLFPGDGGGFVVSDGEEGERFTRIREDSLSYPRTIPDSRGQLRYTGLRLYFAQNINDLKPFTGIAQVDFNIESFTPLRFDDDQFTGLENGTTYFFKAATIDESGTISQFFSDDYCSEASCPYQITPSQVAGVIKESSCFITTATYGSDQAYQVKTFQRFRETFLREHFLGKYLVSLYESYGPHGAVFINNHPWMKPVVRTALTPLYYFSYFSLNYGFFTVLFTLFSLSSALVFLAFKRSR